MQKKKLNDTITLLKKQYEEELQEKDDFINSMFPAVKDIDIKQGWHGTDGTSTWKVTINVYTEDLNKLIKFLTYEKSNKNRWQMIKSEIEAGKHPDLESTGDD